MPEHPSTTRALLRATIGAGLAAGAVMALVLMAVAEISAEATAVAGVDSSSWTPITAITAFLFGEDAYHGSFAPLSILFGLAANLGLSVLFGAAGVALIVWALGWSPGPGVAAVLGVAYGLLLEVAVLNLAVNAIQGENLVYESLPQWGWWVAHAAFGATLGLAAAALLPRAGIGSASRRQRAAASAG